MEFVDRECSECGKKFGNRKPKDAVKLDEPYDTLRRSVEFVAPCPFCGEKIPVWGGTDPIPVVGGEPEPEPEAATEPEPKAS